ncbi:hypothetical protein A2442_01665 [Candidatus Campbellbacteria bacterium RIFOXYC2_FULL_35_25]|uniref:SHSP domain-containing protein n=1 Tax=Candidatus Campbellbacteria bacterium RIFOXYC2_FULL_35_25 TaxID=1797582 RepID=A0A1F5EHL2_9BACT|nr:MAG: hypothetical protein A2442_01665 [Candidatus Campbellbacteria bacterium RIFOXYC2_FULL_35_25]
MKSFFERLTGAVKIDEDFDEFDNLGERGVTNHEGGDILDENGWAETENEEGELTMDMYQTPDAVIIKTMIAGVKPDDLEVSITRDMVTVRGTREEKAIVSEENYFSKELYWGTFSRTITLPAEIDIEAAEAEEKHGLLIIRLPKIDKGRQTRLQVKSH